MCFQPSESLCCLLQDLESPRRIVQFLKEEGGTWHWLRPGGDRDEGEGGEGGVWDELTRGREKGGDKLWLGPGETFTSNLLSLNIISS